MSKSLGVKRIWRVWYVGWRQNVCIHYVFYGINNMKSSRWSATPNIFLHIGAQEPLNSWCWRTIKYLSKSIMKYCSTSTINYWSMSTIKYCTWGTIKYWCRSIINYWNRSPIKYWSRNTTKYWSRSTIKYWSRSPIKYWSRSTIRYWAGALWNIVAETLVKVFSGSLKWASY